MACHAGFDIERVEVMTGQPTGKGAVTILARSVAGQVKTRIGSIIGIDAGPAAGSYALGLQPEVIPGISANVSTGTRDTNPVVAVAQGRNCIGTAKIILRVDTGDAIEHDGALDVRQTIVVRAIDLDVELDNQVARVVDGWSRDSERHLPVDRMHFAGIVDRPRVMADAAALERLGVYHARRSFRPCRACRSRGSSRTGGAVQAVVALAASQEGSRGEQAGHQH